MDEYTGTYSPEDNKLRLYAGGKLPADVYARVKAAGFKWAPKQDLFVAPMWTPSREDLLIELCGEIGDEDTSLVERQEQRAERFEDYSDNRAKDAERAREAVSAIADNIPLGQPILVGHHSERHARRDAKRIENGMRRAVQMWRTSEYWTERAKGAIRHAKYKERPEVRARRIKGIEADKRKQEKTRDRSQALITMWSKPLDTPSKSGISSPRLRAIALGNLDGAYYAGEHEFRHRDEQGRPNGEVYHTGPLSLWEAAGGNIHDYDPDLAAYFTPEEVRDRAIDAHNRTIAWAQRWIDHYDNRLAYERAMLADAGGTAADQVKPEKGGGCRCWASPRGGYSYIQKVNKVSVTVLDNWGNDSDADGSRNFTRNIPFDKLFNLLTARDVETAREDGRLVETQDKTGFILLDSVPEGKQSRKEFWAEPVKEQKAGEFEKMAETLKAGVQVVTAPQLFPTPRELAERMVDEAGIRPGDRVLEPSAGTGVIASVIASQTQGTLLCVELNTQLAAGLDRAGYVVQCADFLECNGDLGTFDRIIMNPPFENAVDIKHIRHAIGLLNPGGRLVALCANGPRQNDQLRPLTTTWEVLPPGTFAAAGTGVNVALLTVHKPDDPPVRRLPDAPADRLF